MHSKINSSSKEIVYKVFIQIVWYEKFPYKDRIYQLLQMFKKSEVKIFRTRIVYIYQLVPIFEMSQSH